MTVLDHLAAALRGRYEVRRELGRGGMAVVLLAYDLKHGRPVAIKVMQPQLAATLGAERFLFEIQTAAQLNHPHILPVFDSGQADGHLYYVMPLVEGESLRARLDREGRLPIPVAIELARQVADALAYAHAHGILHRDIKPENLLLSGPDHVYVLDFGLAKALVTASDQHLTAPGVILGSPLYISPEQARGDLDVGEGADLYSLGCVLYEMLAGHPPFRGQVQQIVGAHLNRSAEPIQAVRPELPSELCDLVARLLAKRPADRVQTASEVANMLTAVAQRAGRPRRRIRRIAAAGGIALIAVALAVVAMIGVEPEAAPLDPDLIAVLPFRVVTADSSIRYLGEGMVDLVTAKLAGQGRPRPVDAQTALSALRRVHGPEAGAISRSEAIDMGRRLGAGQLLMGELVTLGDRLMITARLVMLPEGSEVPPVTVAGPLDSLPVLVDRTTAGVLSLAAHEQAPRLAQLMSTSLPALRAYLEGQAAYRQAAYAAAVARFRLAVTLDSTFALAAMGLASAAGWTSAHADAAETGIRLAWGHRDRLGPLDRLYLTALAGPNYPLPSTYQQRLQAWEAVVSELPDRADAWYNLAEIFLHWGRILDVSDALDRAAYAFNRALDLDSTFNAPLEHLFHVAVLRHDAPAARRLGSMYVRRDSGLSAAAVAWQLSLLPDPDTIVARPIAVPEAGFEMQALVVFFSQVVPAFTPGLAAAEQAAERMTQEAPTEAVAQYAWGARYALLQNLGRPAAALRASEALLRNGASPSRVHQDRVMGALYWNGDTLAGTGSARWLARARSGDPEAMDAHADCVLRQWLAWRGARELDGIAPAEEPAAAEDPSALCRLLVAVIRDHRAGQANGERIARLDRVLKSGPPFDAIRNQANQALARIYLERGEYASAATVARRRVLAPGGEEFLSSFLYLEAEAAALSRDADAAADAYRHFLALREAPEPGLLAQASVARRALRQLDR